MSLPALSIGLPSPGSIAVDTAGNVFVCLIEKNQIWKISPSGSTTVFAGSGIVPTTSGGPLSDPDGVPALAATLNDPSSLAFDGSGNLYVAEYQGHRVRKISTAGIISTVAGTGVPGFSGDGGPATNAQLNNPTGIAIDSQNNLYIADRANHRIRQVSSSGTISTFAGNGVAGFSGDGGPANFASLNFPQGVAVDSSSHVYIADAQNFRVRKVVAGNIATVAGTGIQGFNGDNGPALFAQLTAVQGVVVDRFNDLFILDYLRVRKIAVNSQNIETYAGSGQPGYSGDGGPPALASFGALAGLAFDSSGTVAYAVDGGIFDAVTGLSNSRIRKLTSNVITTFAGNGTRTFDGNGVAALNASLFFPDSLAVDNAGSVYFSDYGSSSLFTLSLNAGTVNLAAGNGYSNGYPDFSCTPTSGQLINPRAITTDPNGALYFQDDSYCVRRLVNGSYITVAGGGTGRLGNGDGGPAIGAAVPLPNSLAVTASGDVYIGESLGYIRKVDHQTGIISTIAGTGTTGPLGDGGPATAATVNPSGLSLDGAGNLFVADARRVRKIVLSTNIITTVAGNGSTVSVDGVPAMSTGLNNVSSIFADESGNLFVAERGASRIRKIDAATNIITTVAGNGTLGFSGDGGPATSASLDPVAIAVDRSQKLYIADGSGRIRRTPVQACFFTPSFSNLNVNNAAGNASVMLSATNSSCPFTVTSNSAFLTITSGANGMGSGTVTFSVAANGNVTARTGILVVAAHTLTITQAAGTLSTADAVSPSSGSGKAQTFIARFSNSSGAGNLTGEQILINSSLNNTSSCSIYTNSAGFYLFNDGGTALAGPARTGTLANSQCSLALSGSSVSNSGNSRIVSVALTFAPAFNGVKNIYLVATDLAGNSTGFQNRGNFTIPLTASTPTADSILPNTGSGSAQTFTASYSDTNGFSNLTSEQLIINSSLSNTGACSLYVNSSGFYLFNDAGTALVGPAAQGGTLSNSQCTFFQSGSSTSGSGNTRTVTFNLSFGNLFSGSKSLYAFTTNTSGNNSGFQHRGSYTIPVAATPPSAVSVSPNAASGNSQAFTAVYSDANGYTNLVSEQLLINSTLSNTNACSLYVNSSGFYLFNDAGTLLIGPATSGGTLANSQCTFSQTGSSVSGSGNSRTVIYNLSFTPAFTGTKSLFAYATNSFGNNSGFQNRGSYSGPLPATIPTSDSISPNSGSGSSQTFTAVFSDTNGFPNLTSEQLIMNSSLSNTNACSLYVNSSGFYLFNDAGTVLMGPAAQGGTLANSQCTFFQNGSSGTGSGNTRSIIFRLTFTPAFTGTRSLYLFDTNASGNNSGFQIRGTFTVQ